jgi:hypothetical protein
MPDLAIIVLDVLTVGAVLASGVLWWLAGRDRLRRVSRLIALDAADIGQIMFALNRTQALNARATLATAVAAGLAGLRVMLGLAGF